MTGFSFGGDTRRAKHLTCPNDMVVRPSSGQCIYSGNGVSAIKTSAPLGAHTWECEWREFQTGNAGLAVRAICEDPDSPLSYKEVEHVAVKYTVQAGPNDNRMQKELTCPAQKVIVPGSGACLRTADAFGEVAFSGQIGTDKWVCTYSQPQPEGVGMWVEADCAKRTQK